MKLRIEIKMDNAAFEDENNGHEAARILHKFAKAIDNFALTYRDWVLMDSNGNMVGRAEVVED